MMKSLPLYKEIQTVVEKATPKDLDPACTSCFLGGAERTNAKFLRNKCIGADGEVGGLLVVGEAPSRDDDAAGVPFIGKPGKLLRDTVKKFWKGPVVYDNAVRCYPIGVEIEEEYVDSCRGYLTQTIREAKPTRIVAVGNAAILALLGRSPPILSIRRGYAWLSDGTPVFFVLPPAMALRNHFVYRWFQEDMEWALTAEPPYEPAWDSVAYMVDSSNIHQAIADLRNSEWVAYDTETSGAMFNPEFTLLCLSMAKKGSQDVWIWDRLALEMQETRQPLIDLLLDPSVEKWGQNVKFDNLAVLSGLGIRVAGIIGDTRLYRRMQDTEASAKLEVLAELVGMGGHKEAMQTAVDAAGKLIRKAIRKNDPSLLAGFHRSTELIQATLDKVAAGDEIKRYSYGFTDESVLLPYNGRDTLSTVRVAEVLEARMEKEPQLTRVWKKVVLPATRALERMEATGVAVDIQSVKDFSATLAFEQMDVMSRLSHYGNLNWNSPKQVAKLLYQDLRLPVQTNRTGGITTGEEALKDIQHLHPIVKDILKNRQLEKLQGTYANGLLPYIRADGRIHATFNPDGAASGRTSSQDPNLQNQPSPSNDPEEGPFYGRMSRDCFVAPPGYVLIQWDYSQLELRIAAALSRDQEMLKIFTSLDEEGNLADFHLATAKLIAKLAWNIEPSKVEKMHRSSAKILNFALLYGKSDAGIAYEIAQRSGKPCTLEQAQQIRRAVLGTFHQLDAWIKESLAFGRKHGFCYTWFEGEDARRRSLYKIADQDKKARENAERSTWNTRIQGTGADFCTCSVARIDQWIEQDCVPASLVLTVHDSIVAQVEESAADEVAHQGRRIMENYDANGVPVVVDMEVGRSWGSMKKIKPNKDGSFKPVLSYLQ